MCDGALEHDLKVLDRPRDSRGLEEIRVVAQDATQVLALGCVQQQRQIGPSGSALDRGRCDRRLAWIDGGRLTCVVQREHDLKERRVTGAPPRLQQFDQLTDGQIPIRGGVQHHVANPSQQCLERGITRQIDAEHQRVGIDADRRFTSRVSRVVDRRTDENVVLPGVAVQQHSERRQQGREQRDVFLATELRECADQLRRKRHGL